MAYTVVGLFETQEQTDKAVKELAKAGFNNGIIDVSPYRAEGDYDGHDYDFENEDKSDSFWDWLFGDDDDEKHSYRRMGARSHLVTVHTKSMAEAENANRVLDNVGALNVKECDSKIYNAGNAGNVNAKSKNSKLKSSDTVEVIEEEMHVGKKEVTDGHVKLKSRIIEKPVEDSIRLKEERVYVKRKPVNRVATEADFNTFKEGSIEMRESHEEAVVKKSAKVVEEVSLDKDVEVETERIHDTVRETKVEVEKVDSELRNNTNKNC